MFFSHWRHLKPQKIPAGDLPTDTTSFIEAAAELETTAATMRLSDSMSKSTEAMAMLWGEMFGSTTGDQLGGLEDVL